MLEIRLDTLFTHISLCLDAFAWKNVGFLLPCAFANFAFELKAKILYDLLKKIKWARVKNIVCVYIVLLEYTGQ